MNALFTPPNIFLRTLNDKAIHKRRQGPFLKKQFTLSLARRSGLLEMDKVLITIKAEPVEGYVVLSSARTGSRIRFQ